MVKTYGVKKHRSNKGYVPRPVQAYVQKAIHKNVENKYFTHELPTILSSISSAWTEWDLCYPSQGDGILNRTGSSIKIMSLELRGVIAQGSSQSAVDDAYNVVRMVIAWYNGGDTTPLTGVADINKPITTEFYTTGYMRKKYVDKYIPLEVTSTEKGDGDGYTPGLRLIKYYKKFKKPLVMKFGDTGTTNVQSRLMISCISDSAGIPNPGFICGYTKVMFEDA